MTMNNQLHIAPYVKTGVFLCRCGGKIDGSVDLDALRSLLSNSQGISHVDILPYPCLAPGMKVVKAAMEKHGFNRLIVAGCESRIMLKKFEWELKDLGLEQGQIDMVNLRDHVAMVHGGSPEEQATKGAKLILSAAAALGALIPTPRMAVTFEGPVMILGGGIATYSAAQELVRHGIDTIMAVNTDDPEDEIRMLHEHYPGERAYHDRLLKIMEDVDQNVHVKKISVGELVKVMGRTGDYQVTFNLDDNRPAVYRCGAIIAALDGQMLNQGSDFGHDGKRVVCQTELEEYIWLHGAPKGKVVLWINDLETPGRPWAFLAARTAWNLATYIKDNRTDSDITILYNDQMKLPLSTEERIESRNLNIKWIAYDSKIRPTVQSGYLTYNEPNDNIEQELAWDMLCLSPLRSPGVEALRTAGILGLDVVEGEFLERNPQMVRPEQVGQEEKFLAGSARIPCDLREALRQGRRAADQVAQIVELAKAGQLYAPRMVCSVDSSKCLGCGLCNEICDCGGIEPFEGKGGNIPRQVDPMVCTGGGTCAAACPYHALTLQNNTREMRQARVTELARSLDSGEILGFGCNWGGGAAADHAGLKELRYDPRFYLMPIGCIGQLDPATIGRAFLEGANGLLLIGCPPEECHHSYGLDHTWSRVNLIKKLLTLCGVERSRVALAHADMNEPERFVITVNRFMAQMDELGPIKRDEPTKEKIRALYDSLENPRVRWVLGAGLRRPYEDHYPSDQRNALAFDQTLIDVLSEEFIKVRVMNLLKKSGELMNLKDISRMLNEDPQPILSSLNEMSSEGIISRIYKDRTPFYIMH
jgi:heterodisulfide reductase subunit A2